MEAIEKWAADEFRSINGQLQWIIADALRRKRIARETIERALAALDGDTAHRRLVELLRRKMKNTRAATPYELKNKLIRYGLAQGYDYEAVRDAVDELIATPDDSCDVFF